MDDRRCAACEWLSLLGDLQNRSELIVIKTGVLHQHQLLAGGASEPGQPVELHGLRRHVLHTERIRRFGNVVRARKIGIQNAEGRVQTQRRIGRCRIPGQYLERIPKDEIAANVAGGGDNLIPGERLIVSLC